MAFYYEKYILCHIVLLAINCTSAVNNCASVSSDGYTIPRGDIILKYGEALNITCNLNEYMVDRYGENASSRLYFTRNNEIVNRAMVDVLNSTSIRLYIQNHEKVKQVNYYCWFWNESMDNFAIEQRDHEGRAVCFNVVFVGVPPQNVTDFSCISRNYENLTCTWTAKTNYVYTSYNLTYRLKLRAARNNRKHKRLENIESREAFLYDCPHLTEEVINEDVRRMSCFWNMSTTPQYRQSHDTFYFRLRMNNTFGTNENNYTFEHYKRVLPNPPENLTAVATSPHSVNLSWVIPFPMINFQPGLQHRILYQCEYYEKVWQFGGLISDANKNTVKSQHFELKDLKYAHALCDIRVSMRSKLADPNDESMWSGNATTTVRTKSKQPDRPPKTNIGSFEISNNRNRDVYVYWQQLMEREKNGENFTYIVEVEGHPTLRPTEITRAYAKFQNISINDYIINIRSVNEIGPSAGKSTVFIPAHRVRAPYNFVKGEEKKDNNTYLFELSWEPPNDPDVEITNYTIFWCSNQRERPYQCEGNLSWVTVPNDTMKYNQTHQIPGNIVYQFAISANSHRGSSGMTWAECTVISKQGMGKMNDAWIKQVGSDFIEVGWKLDCSNRIVGTINSYIIYYCPIEAPQQDYCKGQEQNVTIQGNVYTSFGRVSGLKPYTTYRLTVGFVINNHTYSKTSDPLRNTTNEAAPGTPPQNIVIETVGNSSISLKWEPPLSINGVLRKYLVYYNDQEKTVEPNERGTMLTNLMSYENYTITVKACTVSCSEPSPPVHVLTAMWMPGKIDKPEITFPNDSLILFSWKKPKPARGKIDYYQVEVIRKFSLENKTTPIENVTRDSYGIENCEAGKYKAVYMSVRAVNIIKGEHKAGPWSDVRDWSCQPQYMPIVFILVGVSVIIFAVIMTFCCKRVYIYYKNMSNLDPKLPPGLHQKVATTDSLKSITKFGADEELLLNKLPGGIRSSADSSGCSSGQESITSESTTHISPSDSGTEQPRSPSLGEDRTHSLRQRNVPSGQRPPMNKGYVLPDAVPITNWPPKPAPVTGGSYCVLGVDPSCQTEADTPYVPITNVNTKTPFACDLSQPPPYVVTGDFLKTTNPGYVPYAAAEPADKNTGYVVAGLTKDLVTPDLLQCDAPKPTVVEEKPLYVKAAEAIPNLKGVQFPWQQPPMETSLPKSGYVSVGDAPPPKAVADVAKGYVPHRQFEAKSLKED